MQITCPSCSAQYSVNESRIPPQGVSIKCPKCERSFTVQAPVDGGGVPLPGGGGGGVPLPGGGGGGVLLPGGGGGGVPLPGGGGGGVPLPGGGGGVPLPGGGGGGVPLPGAGGGVPLPGGFGGVPLPGGGGGVPLPGGGGGNPFDQQRGGGAVPLPGGGGGGVPLPGGGGAVPLPGGGGGGVPLPGGGGGGVPLPGGGGGGVPLPGGGGGNPFDQQRGGGGAPAPAKLPGQAASLSDIFGDVGGSDGSEPAPAHPFHGQDSFIAGSGGDGLPSTGQAPGGGGGVDGLLDFVTNRGAPASGPQMFRIRRRSGEIVGPHDEATILGMFHRQELAGNEEASSDGTTWRPLGQIPAFKETIQRAMAAALSGLDLPGLRDSTDLPGLRGSTDLPGLRDADMGLASAGKPPPGATAEEIAQFATASSASLHPSILARRKKRRRMRIAVAVAALVVVSAGASLEYVTPFGAFGWRKALELVKGPAPVVKEDVAQQLPELPEPSVPASQLLEVDTYVAYRQGSEQQGRIVAAGKQLEQFPAAAQKAAGEQARFLAYLVIVERLDLFKPDLAAVIPLAVPGDLGGLLGEVALAYSDKRFDDGIKMLEPLTDESKGLAKEPLSEVHTWIGIGRAGRGEALAAQKSLDLALQARTENLTALWMQGALLEKAGESAAALGYSEKALALSPEHPRANLLKARLLVKESDTRQEGRDLLAAISDGKKAKEAAPIQKAEAFIARAQLAIGDLEWDLALKLMNEATSAVPNNRDMRLQQGELALKLREFSLARDSFKALVDADPADIDAIVGLSRAKIGSRDALGGYSDIQAVIATKDKDPLLAYWFGVSARELLKLEEARKHFEKARSLNPKWAEPSYELINDLVDQGKLKQALDLSTKAEGEVEAGQRHRIRAVKSAIFLRQRNYSLAEKELLAALKENATDVDARVRYVELLVTLQKHNEAAKHAKEARLFDPKNPSVIAAAGIVEAARGDHKRALELFEEATTLAPNDHRLYLHAAASAIALADFGRAKSFVDAAGQLQPKNPEVLNYRGQVMRATDPKQAVRIFTEAIELSPEDPRLPYELGVTFGRMGLNLEARDAYQDAINIDPSFADAFYGKGVSLRELGKNNEAVSTFKEVTRLNKGSSEAHIQLAEILAGQGDPKGAIRAYESAMKADPGSATPLCEMGLMLVQSLGNEAAYLKQGVNALERCVEKEPRHPEAFRKLGDAYRETRKTKKAIEAYRTHMRNNPEDLNNTLVCESLATLGAACD